MSAKGSRSYGNMPTNREIVKRLKSKIVIKLRKGNNLKISRDCCKAANVNIE